jgi:hypothetical protein
MTSTQSLENVRTADYFTISQNGQVLFTTDRIRVEHQSGHISIEGSRRLGFADEELIHLVIDPATPSGEQPFKRGERLKSVFHRNSNDGERYAYEGRFDANLDNDNKKYRLTFELKFYGHTHAIKCEIDVAG